MSAPNSFPINENTIIKPCQRPEKKPALLEVYPSGAHDDKHNAINKKHKIKNILFRFI